MQQEPPTDFVTSAAQTKPPPESTSSGGNVNFTESKDAEVLCREHREKFLTRILTAAAFLRTDPAMLMVGSVLFALGRTRSTRSHTRLKLSSNDTPVRRGLPNEHCSGGIANIGAITIRPDAVNQGLHFRLAKTGVSTGFACLRARKDSINGRGQKRLIDIGLRRMCSQHILYVRHSEPPGDETNTIHNV
jgi:hypothetical protein